MLSRARNLKVVNPQKRDRKVNENESVISFWQVNLCGYVENIPVETGGDKILPKSLNYKHLFARSKSPK